ncbi:hypothetical protein [Microvirga calopogonii]|uniref:hypothetical protein n=1 Tax=Microvirga calopogonii TaxID=2078013 RepID=UPI000E0D060B|nr:hypothetical protein [Microvirga calopogonii]
MSRIFNEIRGQRFAISEIGTAQYRLSQVRSEARKTVQEDIRALFKNLPRGLRHLTHSFLAAEGNRYLLIDLEGPEGGIVNGARTRFTLIDICRSIAGLAAWDVARDEFLGEVNEFSFRDSTVWPDWMVYSNHPQKRKVWTDGVFHADVRSTYFGKILLPVSGPALTHPAFARLADYAKSVIERKDANMEHLRGFDPQFDAYDAQIEEIERKAEAFARTEGQDPEVLTAQNDELAGLIRTMDWTYDMADRPNRAYAEQERRIRSLLSALPVDDAVVLFVHNAGANWTKAPYYLQWHPEVKQMKAAA